MNSARAFCFVIAACLPLLTSKFTLAGDRVLIRLDKPLQNQRTDVGFALETGGPSLAAMTLPIAI